MDWKTSIQDYQILADHNSYNYWDIFCAKELSKYKAIKSICGCHGYHKTCWWNMWRGTSKGLCSLQEMDKKNKHFYSPLGAIK